MSGVRGEPCRSCSIDGCEGKHHARGWCAPHYKVWHRHGDPLATAGRTQRGEPWRFFLAHLDDETDECVVWPYGVDRDGYGVVPRNQRAHVLACTAAHGPRPPGMEVAHSCDTPACFNQRHVRWASHLENEQEKTARGRRPGRTS